MNEELRLLLYYSAVQKYAIRHEVLRSRHIVGPSVHLNAKANLSSSFAHLVDIFERYYSLPYFSVRQS